MSPVGSDEVPAPKGSRKELMPHTAGKRPHQGGKQITFPLPPSARKSLTPIRRKVVKSREMLVDGAITKPALKRLARRGGIKRIGTSTCRPVVQEALVTFLEKVIGSAVAITEHGRRRTVTLGDVLYGMKRNNVTLYGY